MMRKNLGTPFLLITILSSISIYVHAYDLRPSAWKPKPPANLATQVGVETHERTVNINGQTYREIEYKGEKFLLRFLDKQASLQDEEDCFRPGFSTAHDPNLEPYRVTGAFQVAKRTQAFIEGLKVHCQKVVNPLDINAGLSHSNDNGTRSGIHFNPLTGELSPTLQW